MNRKLLENNPCPVQWDNMKKSHAGRACEMCNVDLLDLTETPIQEIVNKHLGTNKCVRLTSNQLDVLSFYKRRAKLAMASSLFIGVSFFNPSFSQTAENKISPIDSCMLKGKLLSKLKEPAKGFSIYVVIAGKTYETKTNDEGCFGLNLPKNCFIEHSNIKKLEKKKIRNQKSINLRKVKTPNVRKSIGFL